MAKKERKSKAATADKPKGRTGMMSWIGVGLVIVGFMIIRKSNLMQPGGVDWMWWTGMAVAVIGGGMWFLSGMPREQAIEWLRSFAYAAAVALIFRWAIGEPYRIPSGSMETTLHGDARIGRGDRVWVNKWVYGLRYPFMNKRIYQGKAPERWDIVVFKSAEDDPTHNTLVKRIVALPGEKVQIRPDNVQKLEPVGSYQVKGHLYINDERMDYPEFMPEDHFYTTPNYWPMQAGNDMFYGGVVEQDKYLKVPEGHYLVLGDNSAHSRDGRYFGWLPQENLVGRVASIWWPPPRWRDFTGFSATILWRGFVTLIGIILFLRIFIGRSLRIQQPPEGEAKRGRRDHIWFSYLSYGFRLPFTSLWLRRGKEPQRGDLVIYTPRTDKLPSGVFLAGYVAGLPGEKVQIQEGQVTANGKDVELPGAFTTEHEDAKFGRDKGKEFIRVPEDQYFLLLPDHDDKENEPMDGRSLGWTPQNVILGKAKAVWFPLTRFRKL